jgi:uncharacterized protein YutE (UPF0331/DUF86 family)
MTNLNVIENKISSAKKYLIILEDYKKYSREEIEKNIDIKGAVERYLYLAIQAVIDLAEAVLAYKNLRKPATIAETFYILNEAKIIDGGLTEKLVKMAGFRNIIAHDYEEINYDIVYDVLQNKLKDLEEFLKTASNI